MAGFTFNGALALSEKHTAVRRWQGYNFKAEQSDDTIDLTVRREGITQPRIQQEFHTSSDLDAFLREHRFPLNGWYPIENV